MRIWDGTNGYKHSKVLRGHTNAVYSVSWHPGPSLCLLASGSEDNMVRIWDGASEYQNSKVLRGHTSTVLSISWHPDPNLRLLASGSFDRTVRIWDGANEYKYSKVFCGHTDSVLSVSWHPDPVLRLLASGSFDRTVQIWDGANGYKHSKVLRRHTSAVLSVSWHPNPNLRLLASGSFDNTVRVWDGANEYKNSKVLRGHTDRVLSVSWHPSSNLHLLVSGSFDKTVRVWDRANGYQNSKVLRGHTDSVLSVSWHPNPNLCLLASGSFDKTVRLWDGANGYQNSKVLRGHTASVLSISWHPDPNLCLLASGSDDKTVRVWDCTNEYKNSKELRGHTNRVHGISWHPNPNLRLLASGSGDKTVRLWDITTGRCVLTENIKSPVLSAAFNNNGKLLAVSCKSGAVIIYKYSIEKNEMILYWSSDFRQMVCYKANFQGAIGLSPRNFRVLQQRGAVKTTMLDEKSQVNLEQAWKLKQQGLILYNKKQYQQALECFQHAVQLAPANKHYQAYVANTLQQLQNPTLSNAGQMRSLPSPQTPPPFTKPKEPMIKQPKFGSHYWYSARNIEKLLNHYAAEFGDVDILTPMVASGIGDCKVMLFQNLEEYEKQRRAKLSKNEPIKDKVLIPLHINTNHWVLLVINYSKDLAKPHDIYYFDPKGGKIPQELIKVLQTPFLYQGSCVIKLQNQINHVQTDGWNCGPWIIVAAHFICTRGILPPATINMNQVRMEHSNILNRGK